MHYRKYKERSASQSQISPVQSAWQTVFYLNVKKKYGSYEIRYSTLPDIPQDFPVWVKTADSAEQIA